MMKEYIAPELNIVTFSFEPVMMVSDNAGIMGYLSRMGFEKEEIDEIGFEDLE